MLHLRAIHYTTKIVNSYLKKHFSTANPFNKQKRFNEVQISRLSEKFLGADIGFYKKKYIKKIISESKDGTVIKIPSGTGVDDSHSRRSKMINSMYYDKIVEIMTVSEISYLFQGYGISITSVGVHPNQFIMLIYWYCSDPSKEQKAHESLTKYAGLIHKQLVTQYVMGRVPQISFVRDLANKREADLTQALSVADFGPDFKPNLDETPEEITTIEEAVPSAVWEEVEQTEKEIEQRAEALLPIMRTDIFGVPRDRIVNEGVLKAKPLNELGRIFPSLDELLAKDKSTPEIYSTDKKQIRNWARKYRKMRYKQASQHVEDCTTRQAQLVAEAMQHDECDFQFDDFMPEYDESTDNR